MREIEFRGQRVDNGKWVYGAVFYLNEEEFVSIITNCQTFDFKDSETTFTGYRVKPESIGQFVGRFDKNENKIFESDFVIDNDGNKTVIVWIKEWSMFGCMFLEEFEKYQLNGISELDESMFWTFPIENNLIEIIGNIHEEKYLYYSLVYKSIHLNTKSEILLKKHVF